jgi:muconolactone D-isomerase
MRFVVHIRTRLPGDWAPEHRAAMLEREFAAGVALMRAGVIRRMFRIVGQLANYSIWEAATLEELHAALQSLPLYAYMTVAVTPVLAHPVEAAYEAEHGPIPPL